MSCTRPWYSVALHTTPVMAEGVGIMICYLIGTNHANQLEGQKDGDSVTFAKYLSAFCSDNRIDLIAEELNEEAIAKWQAGGSVAKSVASRLFIRHCFCDPDREERQRLGVLTDQEAAKKLGFASSWTSQQDVLVLAEVKKSWLARENFWLERLREVTFMRCAFVLGAKHVATFRDLLRAQGFTVHIVKENWKP